MSLPPRETLFQAPPDHDPAFDGVCFLAASGTGAFCRPSCPTLTADDAHPRFFATARDALSAGFYPCKQCRPLHAGEADPEWLPRLMTRVEQEPGRRWQDEDLGKLDLDPVAVRRWFVANHGVTFHAWIRLRRLGLALNEIQQGGPVWPALQKAGYESDSSFREAFVQAFDQPPSEVDRESSIWIGRARTPLGSMIMGVSDRSLYLLEFAEHCMLDSRLKRLRLELGRALLPGEHPMMPEVQTQLDAYFDGSLREFSMPVRATGTVFQEQVWQVVKEIPYGQMVSYTDVAHLIGQREAMRAVGRATGDNRISIVIPCHRVVGGTGELTGYGGGLWRKKYLLSLEQSESFSLSQGQFTLPNS